MPPFVSPPIFNVPRGPSFGGVVQDLGQSIAGIMHTIDTEHERQRKEDENKLFVDNALRDIALKEAATVIPGSHPVGGGPQGNEFGPLPAQDEVQVPGISFKGKSVIAPRTAPRQYEEDLIKAKGTTEALTQETWDQLPKFYQARWKVGQRVPVENLGSVGAQIMKDAEDRAKEQMRIDEETRKEAAHNADAAPATRHVGGRAQQWDRTKRTWTDVGPSEAPLREPLKGPTWVTDANGKRVRKTQAELDAAAPGTYSDVRPAVARTSLSADKQAQSREAALKVLGTPGDGSQDSLWSLSDRLTLPGPQGISGPVGKVAGVAAGFANKLGLAPDVDLYKSQIEGFMPLFARAVGHSGVLTEKDLRRTERLFPTVGDTRDVRTRKLTRLQSIMTGKEPLPPGTFEPQPGAWPPDSSGPESTLSPEEESLLAEYGH